MSSKKQAATIRLLLVVALLVPVSAPGQELASDLPTPIDVVPVPKYIGPCPLQADAVQYIWTGEAGEEVPAGFEPKCPAGTIPGVVGTADHHPRAREGQDLLDSLGRAAKVAPPGWTGEWCGLGPTPILSRGKPVAAVACVTLPPLPEPGPPGPPGLPGQPAEPGQPGPAGDPAPAGALSVGATTRVLGIGGQQLFLAGVRGRWAIPLRYGQEFAVQLFIDGGGSLADEMEWTAAMTTGGGVEYRPWNFLGVTAEGFYGRSSWHMFGGWFRQFAGATAGLDARPIALGGTQNAFWRDFLSLRGGVGIAEVWFPGGINSDTVMVWEFGAALMFRFGGEKSK